MGLGTPLVGADALGGLLAPAPEALTTLSPKAPKLSTLTPNFRNTSSNPPKLSVKALGSIRKHGPHIDEENMASALLFYGRRILPTYSVNKVLKA